MAAYGATVGVAIALAVVCYAPALASSFSIAFDGFTKAQSKAMEKEEALSIFKKLRESGMDEYPKKEIQIWSESRPTIQNEDLK